MSALVLRDLGLCVECGGRGYYADGAACVVCAPPTFADAPGCAWCCSRDHRTDDCADRKREQRARP